MEKKLFNPFPGLRPFQKNESNLFFGRENHIKEILRKLETYRFVSIVGNSGSGKSSLVRAGILPQIEQKDNGSWKICVMRPGKNPVEELCHSLFAAGLFGSADAEERQMQIEENIRTLEKNRLGLVQAVRSVLLPGEKLLILVDQFEELFRFNTIYCEQDSLNVPTHFVDLLLGAVGQNDVPIYMIITVRSDFLGDCERFMGLPEAINDGQFLIPRMNNEELKTSITGPVDFVDGKISPRLVHQLLNEVGNSPDQLPVLQHALMRTWEVWEKENYPAKPVDLEEYEKTGGMAKALSNHAEEAYAELNTGKKKKLAEAIFQTITLKGPDNRGIRRPTPIAKITRISGSSPEEIVEVANIFRCADRGFLMPPASIVLNENSVLDISHESLMRVWERLGAWVEEEAESAEIYQRICESALLYDKNMAGLWRDPDLQLAMEWREKNNPTEAWANQYNRHFALAIRFIDASIQDKKFQEAERNRRRNLTRAVLVFFLITLSGLTLWAYLERNKSAKNENLALEQEALANQQKKVAEENFENAKKEKANAEGARSNAEMQKKFAEQNAMEADLQKMKALRASLSADEARKAAELDKQIALVEKQKAELQRQISDSLSTKASQSERNAYGLRILQIAKNLAIKSTQAQKGTYAEGVKPLLALQAYKFNKAYKGKVFDPEIYYSLFLSLCYIQERGEYIHNYHTDEVKTICFSLDGKNLASAGNDGTIILANASNLQSAPKYFLKQPLILKSIQFNKEGTGIAAIGTSAEKNNILIYETDKPAQKPKQIILPDNINITSFLWYNKQFFIAASDMTIRVIDELTSKVVKTYTLNSKPSSLCFCEEKKTIGIGCENGNVYLIHLAVGNEPKFLKKINASNINALDFNASGSRLACGTYEGNIYIIQPNNPEQEDQVFIAHSAAVSSIKFNPSGDFIASSSFDHKIKLWNLTLKDEQSVIFPEHDFFAYAVAFSPDGSRLASCSKDKTVRVYNTDQEKLVRLLESKLNRNFTSAEWANFIGADIPFEKTIASKQ